MLSIYHSIPGFSTGTLLPGALSTISCMKLVISRIPNPWSSIVWNLASLHGTSEKHLYKCIRKTFTLSLKILVFRFVYFYSLRLFSPSQEAGLFEIWEL